MVWTNLPQTHERTHTNDKPYGCTHCEYRTTSKGNLNKHMMRAHCMYFPLYTLTLRMKQKTDFIALFISAIDNRNHIVNQETS